MEESKTREGEGNEGGELPMMTFFYTDVVNNDRLPCYEEERDEIRGVLSGHRIRFRSEPATVERVRSRLTHGCQILHFTGYGDRKRLEFESDRRYGKAEYLQVDYLRDLISAGGTVPELVCLGSCQPVMAVAEAGVPHVVVAKSESGEADETTRDFFVSFYKELIDSTVQEAFDNAVRAVKSSAATFSLLPKNGNHEVRIFNGLTRGKFIDETPSLPEYFHLPPAIKAYIGRGMLQSVLRMLGDDDTACVTIVGEPGVGKTERALQACHYMGERNTFSAIFFADCKEVAQHSPPFPKSGIPDAHIRRLCQLVGKALNISPATNSPGDLWESLQRESIHVPSKILLVLDAVDALIERGGSEARKHLAGFVDALCCSSFNLKLLVTGQRGLLDSTGRCLSNSTEQVHQVHRLAKEDTAMLLLNLYPRNKITHLADGLGIERGATRQTYLDALQEHRLLQLVKGNPGVLHKVSPLLENRDLDDPEVEETAIRYLNEVSWQAKLPDERCRDIWSEAVSKAAEDGLSYSDCDDACYGLVPLISLSWAMQKCLRGEVYEQSHRDLEKYCLNFIRDLLRKNGHIDGSGEYGEDRSCSKISTGYTRNDEEDEWISLEAFALFSQKWMRRVIPTLSMMRNEWAVMQPVKVHGFVSDRDARLMLKKTGLPGVFMLRFSERNPGCLGLLVTREASRKEPAGDSPPTLHIYKYLVAVTEGTWSTLPERRSTPRFSSLSELVHSKSSLEVLYPNISKAEAFPNI